MGACPEAAITLVAKYCLTQTYRYHVHCGQGPVRVLCMSCFPRLPACTERVCLRRGLRYVLNRESLGNDPSVLDYPVS